MKVAIPLAQPSAADHKGLVLDASAAVALCLSEAGFSLLPNALEAPVLLRSEVLSALQGLQWRREITKQLSDVAVERLLTASVRLIGRRELYEEARRLATSLGWAKSYDAEYVALARLTGLPLLTLDQRLARRVKDLVEVRMP